MSNQLSNLMNRLQKGDHAAAAKLVANFEPEMRRYIRVGICSPQIRRRVESADISQFVLAKFFVDIQGEGGSWKRPSPRLQPF